MNIAELLNIKYPIIQGGMARISRGKLAAAVSNAGGLGLVGTGGLFTDEFIKEYEIAKELIDDDKYFGVNLVLIEPDREEKLEFIKNSDVKFVTISGGNPAKYVPILKEAGKTVYCLIGNSKMAKKCEDLGADGVILEGLEAGGHLSKATSMASLIPTIKATKLPVVAAGGYADGAQVLAAQVMGAAGVQMGTRFLVADECEVHEGYKEAIIDAKEYETDITGTLARDPVRQIANDMTKQSLEYEKRGASEEEFIELYTGTLKRAVFEGDRKTGSMMAGTSIGLIDKKQSVAEIFEELKEEYNKALEDIEKAKKFF